MVYYLRVAVLTPEKGAWGSAPTVLLGEMLHYTTPNTFFT